MNESPIDTPSDHSLNSNQPNEVVSTRSFNWKRIIFWLGSLCVIAGVVALALPVTRTGRESQRREVCEQNIQGLGRAALAFSESHEP
jgi:hypothetical protein